MAQIDFENMEIGDTKRFPVDEKWEGANQSIFYECQDYCSGLQGDERKQFEVQNIRPSGKPLEFWLKRTR